jgi:5-methylcytosine-specific restriction endonuclease McrA
MPFSRGGVDDASNIVPACSDCNRAKGDQMPDAWLAQCRRERKKVNPKLKKWRLGKADAD